MTRAEALNNGAAPVNVATVFQVPCGSVLCCNTKVPSLNEFVPEYLTVKVEFAPTEIWVAFKTRVGATGIVRVTGVKHRENQVILSAEVVAPKGFEPS